MGAVTNVVMSLAVTFGAYRAYKLLAILYSAWTSPLRLLPGPANPSWIYGNLKDIWDAENSVLHEQWVKEYGKTITYSTWFGMSRLYTTDLKALNHVLNNSNVWQKPEMAKYNLGRILGHGVLVVEGEQHKQQRKIMNPAFGAAQIRELTEIFIDKAVELRDIWASEAEKEGGVANLNALSWLSRMTLDVIGLAGFNYHFDALASDPKKNELNKAFSKIFDTNTKMSIIPVLRALIPALRWLPADRDAESKAARDTMDRIGEELLRNSKAELSKQGSLGKDSVKGKTLLTLLLRANMASDLPESQRMVDEDVLAQVPTFLVAGHETTSTATTWALYALSLAPQIQSKLRDELLSISTDNPTMDELNSLPYLDAVVRETLRVHPPVTHTIRTAFQDDVIPLETPFTDCNGKVHDVIEVSKGQSLIVPILAINRDAELWGEDSLEFKPERWEKVPEAVAGIPGIWGNMLTFLSGPRACIGYRFSLVETKAILFTLIRAFEFELAVPAEDIGKKSTIVQRPILRSDPKSGNQLPLLVKPLPKF
ncbi:cytochrome P450 [Coprinopsis marcescibilis]|uniref:Cytochrome P450 n=1 Tax=Coprinopsis marcescibilis TaxID=230819 RepID=A0A5C3L008_COPMA|nr:cytochrome P450 [Coprinopsis marcescibilis]